jgi:hypothetical protein
MRIIAQARVLGANRLSRAGALHINSLQAPNIYAGFQAAQIFPLLIEGCGMSLDAPTVTLFVSVAVVVVICVAFPKVRRTLLGIWDGLDAIDTLFYVLVALVFVGAVS